MNFRYFEIDDFACSQTGENLIWPDFVSALDDLRGICGFPFNVTSGYRSPAHTIEAAKPKPGQHAVGNAADIAVSNGVERRSIVENALKLGVFRGIGVAKTFVHLDIRDTEPVMWTY